MNSQQKVKKKSGRIFAVDNFRGFMIIYITFIHATEFWLRPEDNWIWGMAWLILDVFATAAFVFTAGISL